MALSANSSPLFDGIAQWLMDQGIREMDLGDLVAGMGQKLIVGGIPVHRISVGGMILHPVYGALDVTWEAGGTSARNERIPRSQFATPEFRQAPFFDSLVKRTPFQRFELETDEEAVSRFPLLAKLRDQGLTDYLVFNHSYGRKDDVLWADLPPGLQGVVSSFSTRRIGGFSEREVEYLQALSRPLSLSIKAGTTHDLAETVLNTYLGTYSGGQVLDGLVERGDGKLINCVLWYSDLRDSTALADKMPLEEYLAMVNDYFECTAGAVIDHGGEVLRFIGDAVIAIYPYEAETRPLVDMTLAAVATAREAVARVARRNESLSDTQQPPIRFGMSMHVGSVMYGNIGTEKRLEFSVIGPAANEVVRLEDFCKTLRAQLIASATFKDVYPEEMISLGVHEAAGVAGGLEAFTLPEFQS